MNSNQLAQINTFIDNYNALDLGDLVAQHFPDQDIENVTLGIFPALDFINYSNRVMKQFDAEMNSGMGLLLPHDYNYHNEIGAGNLTNDLNQFLTRLSGANWQAASNHLQRLVYYQIINGFWDKSKVNVHSLRGLSVTSLEEKLQVISTQLNNNLSIFEMLQNDYKTGIDDLAFFKDQKEKELEQISGSLSLASQEKEQISELYNKSIELKEKNQSVFDAMNKTITEIEDRNKKQEAVYESLTTQLETLTKNIDDKLKTFNEKDTSFQDHLSFVESKRDFFEERNNYLNELIGREVGASLFETFKQRKIELKPSVRFWKVAVPVMTLITIVGIYAIFTDIFGLFPLSNAVTNTVSNIDPSALNSNSIKDTWQVFALRTLKCLPLFFLLYFTVHQYTKERNFNEEYAFKSAVALTVKAYSELVKDQYHKDKLILESVLGIYKSPTISRERDKLPSRKVRDFMKGVSESAVDLFKKGKA